MMSDEPDKPVYRHWARKMGTRAAGEKSSFRSGLRRLAGHRIDPSDYSWFDHPEMQARIAEAEADRREGRVTFAYSLEELLDQLHRLE
jgi:hypothetical protein